MSRLLMSWSSGKDGALALHRLRQRGEHEVVGLLTTLVEPGDTVGMHGTSRAFVEAQAAALGLPLHTVSIRATPDPHGAGAHSPEALAAADDYARAMTELLREQQGDGVEGVAFGDIFLEDLRVQREAKLATVGMSAVFPLWGGDTSALARELVAGGILAVTTCVDTEKLTRELLGCVVDDWFLDVLPHGVDPCGEHGEYHSFVFDGPFFADPIDYTLGEESSDDGRFVRRELLPA
ncbi:MAG: Dph6-related ATP pyrophosphatase [Planctomycetota bacterium]|jgi:uncharacterized protein (TIGR00290 family)